jgi:hypothetical protein
MTTQRTDSIKINNEEYILYDLPLEQSWELQENPILFYSLSTASQTRGYHAKWLIENNKLYLIYLYGENFIKNEEYSIKDIFPSSEDKVFAYWFTGILKVPRGKMVKFQHSGWGSSYEYSTTIEVKAAIIVDSGGFVI